MPKHKIQIVYRSREEEGSGIFASHLHMRKGFCEKKCGNACKRVKENWHAYCMKYQ